MVGGSSVRDKGRSGRSRIDHQMGMQVTWSATNWGKQGTEAGLATSWEKECRKGRTYHQLGTRKQEGQTQSPPRDTV